MGVIEIENVVYAHLHIMECIACGAFYDKF